VGRRLSAKHECESRKPTARGANGSSFYFDFKPKLPHPVFAITVKARRCCLTLRVCCASPRAASRLLPVPPCSCEPQRTGEVLQGRFRSQRSHRDLARSLLLEGLHPLSGIRRLTELGGVRLSVVMTLPERTDVLLGRSRRDFGSVLLLAGGMPLGDSVKDNLGRSQSHLSEVRVANHLFLNSLPLR
jgi:hypothetical protein